MSSSSVLSWSRSSASCRTPTAESETEPNPIRDIAWALERVGHCLDQGMVVPSAATTGRASLGPMLENQVCLLALWLLISPSAVVRASFEGIIAIASTIRPSGRKLGPLINNPAVNEALLVVIAELPVVRLMGVFGSGAPSGRARLVPSFAEFNAPDFRMFHDAREELLQSDAMKR